MSGSKLKTLFGFFFNSFPKHKGLCKRGFTLLEMMVAVSIMAIALSSIYKMHAQTIQMNSIARFNAIAPFLAQERIAVIDSKSLEDAMDDSGNFEDDFEKYSYNVTIEEIPSEFLETSKDLTQKSGLILKKINVEISEGENGQKYRFSTIRMVMQ